MEDADKTIFSLKYEIKLLKSELRRKSDEIKALNIKLQEKKNGHK